MAWKGVITNSGNELLAQWTGGKTLTITRAAAGTGRVSETAMLAQTALVTEKQEASIISNKTVDKGQRLQLRITPQAFAYTLNQFGIWAKLNNETEKMIALFQTDTDAGVDIPSTADVPDYMYTFYALLEFSGNEGTLEVVIDASSMATAETVENAIADHDKNGNAHQAALAGKQDKITASGVLMGDGKGGVSAKGVDTTPTADSGNLVTSGGVAAAVENATASAGSNLNAHTKNQNNPHNVTKSQVGLGDVDNTSDLNKPVSTAQQTALNAKQNIIKTSGILVCDGNGGFSAKGVDDTPTADSGNLITSGGVKAAIMNDAAPAGFGLGTFAKKVSSLNDITATGFYYSDYFNGAPSLNGYYAIHMEQEWSYSSDGRIATQFGLGHNSLYGCIRYRYNGEWSSWIWTAQYVRTSYTGTGTYGSDNPNSIELVQRPLLSFIIPTSKEGSGLILYGRNGFLLKNNGSVYHTSSSTVGLTFDMQQTCTWYSTKSADYQANLSGVSYTLFAIA